MILALSLPTASGQQYSNKASISDATYVIQQDSVELTVTISYSYATSQVLKVIVSTYNPAHDYQQVTEVGPGTDEKSITFDLKPKPSTATASLTVSLYMSNTNGDSVSLLAAKQVNVDLTNSSQTGWGAVLLVLGVVFIGILLYFRRAGKKPTPMPRDRHRKNRKFVLSELSWACA